MQVIVNLKHSILFNHDIYNTPNYSKLNL